MTKYLLTEEEINKVKIDWFNSQTYTPLWESFPTNLIAQTQLSKCEKEAKPVWQREAVEIVQKYIDENNIYQVKFGHYDGIRWIPLETKRINILELLDERKQSG